MAKNDEEAVLALPTSAAKADAALVDRAAHEIRSILGATVKRSMEEIGAYLLREFYDDDVSLYLSMNPAKHVSLNLLVRRCETLDLPIKRVFLSRALRTAALLHVLPKSARFRALPDSHRTELLSVRDPERIEELAVRAMERKLTVVKLRDAVRRERVKALTPGRGRPPIPPVLKALDAAVKLLRDDDSGRLVFRKTDIDALDEAQIERARAALRILAKRVNELERLLD